MSIEAARFTNIDGSVLIMNTDTDYPFEEFLTEVEGRSADKNKSQQHGQWPTFTYLGKRLFHANGAILADNPAEYWEKRLAFIRAFMPHPHLNETVCGTLTIQYAGILEELECDCTIDGWPEIPLQGLSPSLSEYQLNLKAFDPKLYGSERSTFTVAPPVSDYGVTFDRTFDTTFPQANIQPQDVIIVNSGNIETYPRFVIEGHAVNPRLVLTRYDGEQLTVALDGLTVTANDYVELDFDKRTAVMNGDIDVYDYTIGSQWWALEPTTQLGVSNIVSFRGTDIQEGANATIFWRNAYMI
jgi:hypothetical protein